MSKERPILFNAEMVNAILDGKKTQTRRLKGLEDVNKNPTLWEFTKTAILDWKTKNIFKGRFGAYFESDEIEERTISVCPCINPFGQPGDRLWVRENAYIAPKFFSDDFTCTDKEGDKRYIGYSANMNGDSVRCAKDYGVKQTPSIHMPRWASRITLEITSVRVERVKGISIEDAISEGVKTQYCCNGTDCGCRGLPIDDPRLDFKDIWDSIYRNWKDNPWVWVIEFKKAEATK